MNELDISDGAGGIVTWYTLYKQLNEAVADYS